MQKSVHIVYLLLFLCASFAIIPVSCSYSDLRNSVLSTSLALSASDINIPEMAVRHGRNKQYIVLGEKRSEDELSVSQSSRENFSNMRRKRQKQRAGDSTMVEHSISSTVVGVTDAVPDTAAMPSCPRARKMRVDSQKTVSTVATIGQASYQRSRSGICPSYADFGDKIFECRYCNALFWLNESTKVTHQNQSPTFTLCCQHGRVTLPSARPTPKFLDELLDPTKGHRSLLFRQNIRIYNSMFCFTSMGAKIERTINDGSSPYVFKISGQVHHLMGSLLPPENESPKYAQLYVYDTQHEVTNRIRAIDNDESNDKLDPSIVHQLITMFDDVNELVRLFRTKRNEFENASLPTFRMTMLDQQLTDSRQYEQPACNEISGLIVGDIGLSNSNRDIVVQLKDERLQRVSKLHLKYMSLQYPIFFPYGKDGYSPDLKMQAPEGRSQKKREKMSMRSFISYQIQERTNQVGTLLKGGRLFQQFLVDSYATIKEDRLDYIRKNQKNLRSEAYKGIYDAHSRGDNDARNLGQKVILPSTYTGSPRYMINNYQDAMAICRRYGNPDLFITFTCNVKWPEITREFQNKPGFKPEDRPDIISRVFKMKLDDLVAYIKSGEPFGNIEADLCTIEFQKRGLPHSHMLFWLKKEYKCYSAIDIDSIICAELPDKYIQPELYEIVSQFMIHGPCGYINSKSPCMRDGKCSKFFPKSYQANTIFETNAAPLYRRRDDSTRFVVKNGVNVDNSFVVPYNANLLLKYNAHINVESCSQSMLIKYLFKYINKGPDRARILLQDNLNDEIQTYLNCRYLSPPESVWRLFAYDIHSRHPAVERLSVHLPLEQNVIFNESQSLESIINSKRSEDTTLTGWFKANATYDEARTLSYIEFPSKFVWDNNKKYWKPRQRKGSIGRIANVHPASGELYYLRMLLHIQKGCTNYDSIKTFNGIIQPSFQETCRCFGLLGDDKEWIEALLDSSHTAIALEMRQLFVTILLFCDVANPQLLFDTHWINMSEDIPNQIRREFAMPNLNVSEFERKNRLLFELEKKFNASSSSLKNYHLPMPDENMMQQLHNRMLREELNYDCNTLKIEHSVLMVQLNFCQKNVYEAVIKVVEERKPGTFFVHGHGGTGKTFLWHAIISKLRSEGKIVLAVASSGIASLLLPGGRTAHSRFKIPLNVNDCSICPIKKSTNLAKLIEKADLIIWDEAPMNHKYCFESLDKSLRDILPHSDTSNNDIPFGGKLILFGGDFRQILPVVTGGTKEQIIDASLNSSYLWSNFTIFHLTENMRLSKVGLNDEEKEKIASFARWILEIGDGLKCDINDDIDEDASWVEIPTSLLIDTYINPIHSIFVATYPDFDAKYNNFDYLRERAIVTPRNDIVRDINDHAINLLPGNITAYLSSDTICTASENHDTLAELYPIEFLNSLEFNGLPSHELQLKIGMPIMLLRNIDQAIGLCNGTRLIITKLYDRIIEAKILTGNNIGHQVYLPRIVLTATENKWPFILKRLQFPIRPCYAMTINKSQGQSLKQVGIYLPEPVFTHGQLYVALSRVTSIDGLKILIQNNNGLPNKYTKNIVFKDVLQKL